MKPSARLARLKKMVESNQKVLNRVDTMMFTDSEIASMSTWWAAHKSGCPTCSTQECKFSILQKHVSGAEYRSVIVAPCLTRLDFTEGCPT